MTAFSLGPDQIVGELLSLYPQTAEVFLHHRMACVGCDMSAFETLADAARIYGVTFSVFLGELESAIGTTAD